MVGMQTQTSCRLAPNESVLTYCWMTGEAILLLLGSEPVPPSALSSAKGARAFLLLGLLMTRCMSPSCG